MTIIAMYIAELILSQFNGRKTKPIPEGVTFEELKDIARRNHITYLIMNALLTSGSLSSGQEEEARRLVLQTVYLSAKQQSEFSKWQVVAEEKHITNQPLKGIVMKTLYPRPEMREMSDIDVLIGEDSLDRAKHSLLENGYVLHQEIKHHDIYIKDHQVVFEAHRDIYDKNVDKTQFEYFQGFKRANLKSGLLYTYEYGIEDFYVFMIAHAAKHFYEMGCGIRNLIDIYVYQKVYGNQMDLSYLNNEFSKCGLVDFVNHMERLSFYWLEKESDGSFSVSEGQKDIYDSLFQYMCDSGTFGKDANGIWNKFAEESVEDNASFQLRRWYYLPPKTYMEKYYPWLEKKPWLLPFSWIIRFYRGMFFHKGEKKRSMINEITSYEIHNYQKIYQLLNLRFKG